MKLTKEQLTALRALRLWHWQGARFHRGAADWYRKGIESGELSERMSKAVADRNKVADRHIKFVQTLNDFFPADDTAEKDAAKTP